jgi:hypothetical protein
MENRLELDMNGEVFISKIDDLSDEDKEVFIEQICNLERQIVDLINGKPAIIAINAMLRCVAQIVEMLPEEDRSDALASFALGVMMHIATNEERGTIQ